MSFHRIRLFCLFVFCLVVSIPVQAQDIRIIRDTEIEMMLRDWSAPLMQAAGMGPESVRIALVQDSGINAFVAGGANIFLFTGLLQKTENPGEVIGVIAHELGHVAGGHLIAGRDAMDRATTEAFLGTLLGLGAAIAAGDGSIAAAASSGSQNLALRRFLAHSRLHESSADQAAFRYMDAAGYDPEGLVTFFRKLESEEFLPASRQSEYVRTHPLTADRVRASEVKASESAHYQKGFPAQWNEQHARMKAKLIGYLQPSQVQWFYNDRDITIPARYARAIAAYRTQNIDAALREMDALLAVEPNNPYFMELKAQALVSFGEIEQALPLYHKALQQLPQAALIRVDYAHALLELGRDNDKAVQDAVEQLKIARREEERSARIHRLLATAYGRQGNQGLTRLHLAEEATLQRRYEYAKQQLGQALNLLPSGTPDHRAALDLKAFLETIDPE